MLGGSVLGQTAVSRQGEGQRRAHFEKHVLVDSELGPFVFLIVEDPGR